MWATEYKEQQDNNGLRFWGFGSSTIELLALFVIFLNFYTVICPTVLMVSVQAYT